MPAARPVVTFTSDFGARDSYVAQMKAAVLRHCPNATLIDVTHEIARHDILAGAIALERVLSAFAEGAVHLAVIDPGVGTARRILLTELNGQTIVCPDNGLITWAWNRIGPARARELTWRPPQISQTFHGRDIMAPAAGMIAAGADMSRFSWEIDNPQLLDLAPAGQGSTCAVVIHVDSFGNATTNFPAELLASSPTATFRFGRLNLGPLKKTYGDVEPSAALALIGSGGLLEIAAREGSAAEQLGIQLGDEITVET